MIYTIRAAGIKQVQTKFYRMGTAAVNARPVMTTIAELMMGFVDRTFQSEGRRGGGSWKRDTLAWLTRKQREGLDPRVGHATLALRRAFTVPGDDNQILDIGETFVHLATNLPYAATEQRHRPFIKFTQSDKLVLRHTVRDYLVAAWRTA